ncbi:hypothetical protein GCM10018781_47690 [Kitasatospora indigofera]|uniref:Uncharacterized protein n=1 Tax=Kitasatospora indigofera TaxID=67307 RepID=A0A919G1L6_9ACTN|nr:hypothetical protein GCM10018781_47690 [Kitasatospora indigofera]
MYVEPRSSGRSPLIMIASMAGQVIGGLPRSGEGVLPPFRDVREASGKPGSCPARRFRRASPAQGAPPGRPSGPAPSRCPTVPGTDGHRIPDLHRS